MLVAASFLSYPLAPFFAPLVAFAGDSGTFVGQNTPFIEKVSILPHSFTSLYQQTKTIQTPERPRKSKHPKDLKIPNP